MTAFVAAIVGWSWMAEVVTVRAAEPAAAQADPSDDQQARELYTHHKASVVVIRGRDRDGREGGLGTGFVVDPRGLIATNLHVIGEGRDFQVFLADGRAVPVVKIHAMDRGLDLAVLEVTPTDPLPALQLGTDAPIQAGEPVVVIGHPQGLQHSVVQGVLSERREVEGRSMLQLAMPIEPGNSGSPVLDQHGRVQGVVTLKSAVTDNLGFAGDVRDLQKLLDRPNPIPIETWRRIAGLDPTRWDVHYGANWHRRSGRIRVSEPGTGDGGRTFCLTREPAPGSPSEVSVWVRLDQEDGAAGLVFLAEDGDRHYGFYPSGGSLRLTCFQGSTVFTWEVLHNQPHSAYRPGEWNHLKVLISPQKISCYINDQLAIETNDVRWTGGRAGLTKFRQTSAEFRQFEWTDHAAAKATESSRTGTDPTSLPGISPRSDPVTALATGPLPKWDDLIHGQGELVSRTELLERAETFRAQARRFDRLAEDMHVAAVCRELSQLAGQGDRPIDVVRGALLISRLDNPDVEVDEYLDEFERLADQLREQVDLSSGESERLASLNRILFEELGFHGSRADYYHRANSYMDRVLDDREGIPITLSVLYVELARQLGLNMVGVPLPGHFCAGLLPQPAPPPPPRDLGPEALDDWPASSLVLVDPFDQGRAWTRDHADAKVFEITGQRLQDDELRAAEPPEILHRMLRNLLNLAERDRDRAGMLRYLEAMLAIDPKLGPERGVRAILRFERGRVDDALSDLDWMLTHQPPGVDLQRVVELRRMMEERRDQAGQTAP
ncbi:MAG: transglutaminase family protein [Pirellulales bacterium]